MAQDDIQSVLKEDRVFPPNPAFAAKARLAGLDEYRHMHRRSIDDPAGFWGEAAEQLHWFRKWDKVVEWNLPFAKWFVGAQTNISTNCLDRQVAAGLGDKPAILWEGEPGDERTLTFRELLAEVCRFANALRKLGVKKGDRVTIYMPMVPELAVAMLACARIGAPHSIVFGGFSAEALLGRIEDARSHVVITADGGWRRGKVIELKANVDEAIARTDLVKTVVVLRRTENQVAWRSGRDHWWHEVVEGESDQSPAEPLDSEHLLFILYTSGTTGKPKGIVHTTGGYMVGTWLTSRYVFDLKDDDIYWCTADIGWVTGHSYIVYGILANGVTTLMYEGAPNHPGPDRFWKIIEKYKVNVFYTAPTAIRAFIKWGEEHPAGCDLSSLRLLGTVGEPINPEAWMWYHRVIGGERCPIVDTWWQTETGSIMITPLPGATPTKPGSATLPFFGVEPAIMSRDGEELPANAGGFLVIKRPWPAMLRNIYGDEQRYRRQYWSEIEGVYFTGDGARRDEDGYFWIMGRVDDVINVAGHRLGTMEIESALVSHAAVAEAAVVGRPDDLKGQAICAFVTLENGQEPSDALRDALKKHVTREIGALARPDDIRFTDSLPKTRSGKIMRRLLKDIASGAEKIGDTTTLEDYSVLARLRESNEG